MNTYTFPNSAATSDAAAQDFTQLISLYLSKQSECYIALPGGSALHCLAKGLANSKFTANIAWERVHVYLTDERFVPSDHRDSNFNLIQSQLTKILPIPNCNIYPINTALESPQNAALDYIEKLPASIFDLIVLGLGADGHIASLFPDTEILHIKDSPVAAVYVNKLASWRISLTFSVLNQAKNIMCIITGKEKADILPQVFIKSNKHKLPIHLLEPKGKINWYLDQAAASKLNLKTAVDS